MDRELKPKYERRPNGSDDAYYHEGGLDPWTLERAMQSTGSAFIDARRCDIIEYAFRLKGGKERQSMLLKLKEDLVKVRDNAEAAITEIDRILKTHENHNDKTPPENGIDIVQAQRVQLGGLP